MVEPPAASEVNSWRTARASFEDNSTWTVSWRIPPVRVVLVISGVTVTVTGLPGSGARLSNSS